MNFKHLLRGRAIVYQNIEFRSSLFFSFFSFFTNTIFFIDVTVKKCQVVKNGITVDNTKISSMCRFSCVVILATCDSRFQNASFFNSYTDIQLLRLKSQCLLHWDLSDILVRVFVELCYNGGDCGEAEKVDNANSLKGDDR